MRGYATAIDVLPVRTYLTSDADQDASVISVTDGTALAVPGAQAVIGGEPCPVESVEFTGTDEPDIITLETALTVTVEAGEPIDILPRVNYVVAEVELDGDQGTVYATVQQDLQGKVATREGAYEGDDRPVVEVEVIDGEHVIVDIDGLGAVDGSSIDGPIPAESQPAPVAPGYSPVPTVTGLLRQLLVMVPGVENATPVEYEYHVSTSDAVAADASTLVTTSSAAGVSITTTADGVALAYDVDYYVAVVAKSGPMAAVPSAWVLGRLDRAGTADMAVGSVTAEQLSAIITISSLFRTAEVGQRMEFDNDGIRVYDSTGAAVITLSPSEVVILADRFYTKYLETSSARLGGKTEGPAGGEFALGTGIVEAPGSALQHKSGPLLRVALKGGEAGPAFTDASGSYWWQMIAQSGGKYAIRRTNGSGTSFTDVPIISVSEGVLSAALSTDYFYAVRKIDGIRNLARRERTSPTEFGQSAATTMPTASGSGGYYTSEPVISVQRGSGETIVMAHRVRGAQTVGGLDYADNEVMVRRYTASGTGSSVSLSLVQTIKTGLVASSPLDSVLMDAPSGSFDLPAQSGNTVFALSSRGGFSGDLGSENRLMMAPNTGSNVTAAIPANSAGLRAWFGQNLGLIYSAGSWYGTEVTGDTIAKYALSAAASGSAVHAYTFFDGTHESKLSPVLPSSLFARYISRWTIPTLPAGVSQVRLYVAAADTLNRYERVGTFTGTSGRPLSIQQAPPVPPAGTATNQPPATSDFPGGVVYKITTADPDSADYGDGKRTSRYPLMPNDIVNLQALNDRTGPVRRKVGVGEPVASGTTAITVDVTFASPFPTATYAVVATSGNGELTDPRVFSKTVNGFSIRWDRSAAVTGGYTFDWIAEVP